MTVGAVIGLFVGATLKLFSEDFLGTWSPPDLLVTPTWTSPIIFLMEITLFITGCRALFRGRFAFSKEHVAEGVVARLAGLVMVLPPLIGFGFGFSVGVAFGMDGSGTREVFSAVANIELVATLCCAACGFGLLAAGVKRRSRRAKMSNLPGPHPGPARSSEEAAHARLPEAVKEKAEEEQAGNFLLGEDRGAAIP
jgi:hypothetical protein